MSVYTRSQPVAGENLDISQPKLVTNCNACDDAFGVDHYPFSNTTSNRGYHNTVTQPAYQNPLGTVSATVPVTVANPILFSFQPSSNVGVIQYSRGPNAAVPSPVTTLQSPSTAITLGSGATTNVLDFTGLTRAAAIIYAYDTATTGVGKGLVEGFVIWGSAGLVIQTITNANFTLASSGNILQIRNSSAATYSNVFWTLQLLRTS